MNKHDKIIFDTCNYLQKYICYSNSLPNREIIEEDITGFLDYYVKMGDTRTYTVLCKDFLLNTSRGSSNLSLIYVAIYFGNYDYYLLLITGLTVYPFFQLKRPDVSLTKKVNQVQSYERAMKGI